MLQQAAAQSASYPLPAQSTVHGRDTRGYISRRSIYYKWFNNKPIKQLPDLGPATGAVDDVINPFARVKGRSRRMARVALTHSIELGE